MFMVSNSSGTNVIDSCHKFSGRGVLYDEQQRAVGASSLNAEDAQAIRPQVNAVIKRLSEAVEHFSYARNVVE